MGVFLSLLPGGNGKRDILTGTLNHGLGEHSAEQFTQFWRSPLSPQKLGPGTSLTGYLDVISGALIIDHLVSLRLLMISLILFLLFWATRLN